MKDREKRKSDVKTRWEHGPTHRFDNLGGMERTRVSEGKRGEEEKEKEGGVGRETEIS